MVEVGAADSFFVEVASIILVDASSIIFLVDDSSIIFLLEDSCIILADEDSCIIAAEVVAIGASQATLAAPVPTADPSVMGIPLGAETAGSLIDESGVGTAKTPEKSSVAARRGAKI
jgi:hypothetical protein